MGRIGRLTTRNTRKEFPGDHTRSPKPVKDTTPDVHELTLKARAGSSGALMQFINHQHSLGAVSQGLYIKRSDGSVDQTITVVVYELAKHYEPKPEQPFEDKSGFVYLLKSLVTDGRFKLGESIHPRQREQEVSDSYHEPFKIIAVQYVSDNRFARETWLKAELVRWGCKRLEREAFQMTDEQVERFIALGNE